MAYAGALFADACLRGLNGDPDVVVSPCCECTALITALITAPFLNGDPGVVVSP